MYALRKIKEIKGYRFFQDFHWNENGCDLFSQNNLIYGWNGSGKTTLCDFMYSLETGSFSEENISFSLLFEDTATQAHTAITQGKMNTLPYRFRVFHQNYIQENIAVDNVKHIFSVGREQIEKVNEVKRLRSTLGELKDKAQKAEIELRDLEKEFDRIKTAKAKIIKDAAQYSNSYNKNKYYLLSLLIFFLYLLFRIRKKSFGKKRTQIRIIFCFNPKAPFKTYLNFFLYKDKYIL